MNDFTFTGQGFSDHLYWQTQDRKTLKKTFCTDTLSWDTMKEEFCFLNIKLKMDYTEKERRYETNGTGDFA